MNRLKEAGQTVARKLLVTAAIRGAEAQGYTLERQPGRGLSSVYVMSKDGDSTVTSLRTTQDRWIAFPPLDKGKRWKTLDDVETVLVSAVDDPDDPQNVSVHIMPADEVRRRFDESYAARMAQGHTVRDNFGMWVMLDKGDPKNTPTQAGHSLAIDYPAIAEYSLDELEAELTFNNGEVDADLEDEDDAPSEPSNAPALHTVSDVLEFARARIAELTGMPADAIKLDLKMGV